MDERIAEAISLYKQALEQGDMETAQAIKQMLEQMGIDVDDLLGEGAPMMGGMVSSIQERLRPEAMR